MTRLKKLARRGTWEVGMLPFPEVSVRDIELEGMLFVVESLDQLVRGATPVQRGDDLGELLISTTAATSSLPAGRPKTIRCNPEIFHLLERAAAKLGARLVAAEVLPAVEHFAMSLKGHLAPALPPLPLPDPSPWVPVIRELAEEAPWQFLHDEICFGFHGTPLDGWIGLCIGMNGEQLGLVFYPDIEAIDALLDIDANAGLPDDFLSYCVHLDPHDEVSPDHLEWAQQHDLVFGDRVLVPFLLDSGGMHPLDPDESTRWLAATRAVLTVWKTHGRRLLVEPTTTTIRTAFGPLEVQTDHADALRPGPLVPEEHQLFFELAPGSRRLCFKAAKADAERIARRLREVQQLVVEPGWTEVQLSARMLDGNLVAIATMPADADLWAAFRDDAVLVVLKGGAKRRSYRVTDVLLERPVPIVGPLVSRPMDPSWRERADYSGPPGTWPPASTVLLAFGESLGLDGMPPDAFRAAVDLLSSVWSAVVLADVSADGTVLADLRSQMRQGGPVAIVETLIALKRSEFAHDTRIMVVDKVTWAAGQASLKVMWRDARG